MKNDKKTRHHLVPKERTKKHTEIQDQSWLRYQPILMLWKTHHDAWHFLFGNATLKEIIKILQRIEKLKYLS